MCGLYVNSNSRLDVELRHCQIYYGFHGHPLPVLEAIIVRNNDIINCNSRPSTVLTLGWGLHDKLSKKENNYYSFKKIAQARINK